MNKKSFILGVFVGILVTWALSFYLYYSLNNNQTSELTKLQKNIFNFDNSGEDSGDLKISNSIVSPEKEQLVDGKESYFKSKLKKEKEKRKISQKLMDQLQPVTAVKQFEEFGIIRSIEDQATRDSGYKTHAFNVLVSNNLGSFRHIPDTRHKV